MDKTFPFQIDWMEVGRIGHLPRAFCAQVAWPPGDELLCWTVKVVVQSNGADRRLNADNLLWIQCQEFPSSPEEKLLRKQRNHNCLMLANQLQMTGDFEWFTSAFVENSNKEFDELFNNHWAVEEVPIQLFKLNRLRNECEVYPVPIGDHLIGI